MVITRLVVVITDDRQFKKLQKQRHWPPLTIEEVKTAFFMVLTRRVVVITNDRQFKSYKKKTLTATDNPRSENYILHGD
jgi:UDP-2,3-diacylglucosamine pyrophosphatase LpxH